MMFLAIVAAIVGLLVVVNLIAWLFRTYLYWTNL